MTTRRISRVFLLLFSFALAGAAALCGCEPGRATSAQTEPQTAIPPLIKQGGTEELVLDPRRIPGLTIAQVRDIQLPGILEANGQVTFDDRRVASITSRVSGRIEEVRVSQWDSVRKGEPIIRLYSPDFMTAEAEYVQSEAMNRNSQNAAAASGVGGDIGPQLVEAARRKLQLLGMDDADIRALKAPSPTIWMRAPVGGMVVENKATRGAAINVGDVLYSLGTIDEVWITASIYEDDLARVHVGQQMEAVTTAFPDEAFKGAITRVSPGIDPNTHTGEVRCEVRNPNHRLRPQMLARVKITVQAGSALVVPQTALIFETNAYYAFVLATSDRIERRAVKIASWNEQGYARIVSGLRAGETVVNGESIQVNALWHQAHGEGS